MEDYHNTTMTQLHYTATTYPLACTRVCRICLATNTKQYNIQEHRLRQMYDEITGFKLLTDEENYPQKVCWECAHRLNSFSRYRTMALHSHDLMQDLLTSRNYLTLRDISTIDREEHYLTSKLTHKALGHYDVGINECFENDHENYTSNRGIKETEESNKVFQMNTAEENFECIASEEDNKLYIDDGEDSKREINAFDHANDEIGELNFVVKDYTFILNDERSNNMNKSDRSTSNRREVRQLLKNNNISRNIKNISISHLYIDDQTAELKQRQYIRPHKNGRYKCTTCYKTFKYKGTYNNHVARHTRANIQDLTPNLSTDISTLNCKTYIDHYDLNLKHDAAHTKTANVKESCTFTEEVVDDIDDYLDNNMLDVSSDDIPAENVKKRNKESFSKKNDILNETVFDVTEVSNEEVLAKTAKRKRKAAKENNDNYIKPENELLNEAVVTITEVSRDKVLRKNVRRKNKVKIVKDDNNANIDSYIRPENEVFNETVSARTELSNNEVITRNVKKKKKINTVQESKPKIDKRRKPANEVLNETVFNITDLSYDEQIGEILKRRESANFKNSAFKCMNCFKGFLDEVAYNSHMLRHTDQCGTHACEICKIHFKHKRAVRNHLTMLHKHKFSCKLCPFIASSRHSAKLHEQWHNGATYRCPHCQECFRKLTTYMGHIRIKHPSDIVCSLCGYSFVSEKGLLLHKRLKHRFNEESIPDDGPYCGTCTVRFASKEALQKHQELSPRHKDINSTDASNGGRRKPKRNERNYKKNIILNKQRKPQTNTEPIDCEQCGISLPDASAYYRHFRRTHPDKNRTNFPAVKSRCMCEVCGKMFQSLAILQDHSFTHSETKPFKCTVCSKTFQRKYRLIVHKQLHFMPRAKHSCTVCGKAFSTASNRQRHMLTHTGLKPYKCELCGSAHRHPSDKRAHISYVHLKKPWPKRKSGRRRHDSKKDTQVSMHTSASEMDIVQPLSPLYSDDKNWE